MFSAAGTAAGVGGAVALRWLIMRGLLGMPWLGVTVSARSGRSSAPQLVKSTPAKSCGSRVDAGNQAGGGRLPDRIDP
jgi:hypothetical protein